MAFITFVFDFYNKVKQPVFGNLVSSGLVCRLDPLKWPSSPKKLAGLDLDSCVSASSVGTYGYI